MPSKGKVLQLQHYSERHPDDHFFSRLSFALQVVCQSGRIQYEKSYYVRFDPLYRLR